MTGHPDGVERPADLDTPVVELASQAWCWSHLRSTAAGTLSCGSGIRASSLSVGWTVTGQQLLIPIASCYEPARAMAGSAVTLALAGHTDDGLRWVVRATGAALLSVLAGDSLADCRSSHPARSSAPLGSDVLLLTVARLRGYHELPPRTAGPG